MSDIQARIVEYLDLGGFFNPEAMSHDKVRTLIMDAADEICRLRAALLSSDRAVHPDELADALAVLPDSLGRPLAARISLVLDNLRRESHIGVELRRELDGGIERDAKAIEAQWPEAATYLRSHAHIEDGA